MNNENYLFGNICGDSDVIVDRLIENGQKFDLILTDPPYNINKDFGNNSDCLPLDDFINITNERIKKLKQVLTPTGSIIWFGIHDYICGGHGIRLLDFKWYFSGEVLSYEEAAGYGVLLYVAG